MKKRTSYLTLALSILLGGWVNAQEFSLTAAQTYALEHYYEAVNAGLDIKKSKSKIWETTAIGLPQVDGKMSYRNALDLEFDFPQEALNQPGNEFLSVFAADNISQGMLEASQLIFDGSFFVGLQASRKYLEFSENEAEKTQNDVKANVASSYYLALVAQENIEVLEGSFSNLENSIKETAAMVNQGFLEETELDQLKLMESDLKSSLETAKLSKTVAYKMLKLNMGLPLDTTIVLVDDLKGIVGQISMGNILGQQFDATNNPDLKVLRTQKELVALDLKRYRAQRLPTIAAFYQYQNTAYQLDWDWYQDATWFDAQNLGVSISVPLISSGMQGAKIKQAKLELTKMENTLAFYEDAMAVQYENALNDITTKFSNYENAKKSMEIAEKIFSRTEAKYKEGMTSSFELSQIKNQLLEAQGKYIQSLFELLNAKAKLDQLQNK